MNKTLVWINDFFLLCAEALLGIGVSFVSSVSVFKKKAPKVNASSGVANKVHMAMFHRQWQHTIHCVRDMKKKHTNKSNPSLEDEQQSSEVNSVLLLSYSSGTPKVRSHTVLGSALLLWAHRDENIFRQLPPDTTFKFVQATPHNRVSAGVLSTVKRIVMKRVNTLWNAVIICPRWSRQRLAAMRSEHKSTTEHNRISWTNNTFAG